MIYLLPETFIKNCFDKLGNLDANVLSPVDGGRGGCVQERTITGIYAPS